MNILVGFIPSPNNLANEKTSEQKATRHHLLKGPKISFKYCATKGVKIWFRLLQNIKLKFNFQYKSKYIMSRKCDRIFAIGDLHWNYSVKLIN